MIKKRKITGVYSIIMDSFSDDRGTIREIFRENELDNYENFVQVTHTRSKPKVLRGLHPQPWDRIVYPVNGKVYQVLVDTRIDSNTQEVIEAFEINDNNRQAVFVPANVSNGYLVLGNKPVDYLYFLPVNYSEQVKGFRWDSFNINWPTKNPILSEKDKKNPTFKEYLSGGTQ